MTNEWSVGIDVGHGETAAARMSLRSLLIGAEVTSLEIDNRKSIITAVARTPAGEVLLGKTALVRDDAVEVRAAFKAEPSQLGPGDRRALQTFFCRGRHRVCLEARPAAYAGRDQAIQGV